MTLLLVELGENLSRIVHVLFYLRALQVNQAVEQSLFEESPNNPPPTIFCP